MLFTDSEEFAKDTRQKQQEEIRRFEQNKENCEQILHKYDLEMFAKRDRPGLDRLGQMKRTVTMFIRLFTKDSESMRKNDSHSIKLPESYGQFDGYFEWKKGEIDSFIRSCEASLQSIDAQIKTAPHVPIPANLGPMADDEKRQKVQSILARLSGMNSRKLLIMNSTDFDRLINYTTHLVLTQTLPTGIITIPKGISNGHVRYTFYLLHKQIFGTTKKLPVFIDFLYAVFPQFNGTTKETTNSKFSESPNSYERDFAGYIGEAL